VKLAGLASGCFDEGESEAGAATTRFFDLDAAAVVLGDLSDDCESEAGAWPPSG
jgi:hypothetical protein